MSERGMAGDANSRGSARPRDDPGDATSSDGNGADERRDDVVRSRWGQKTIRDDVRTGAEYLSYVRSVLCLARVFAVVRTPFESSWVSADAKRDLQLLPSFFSHSRWGGFWVETKVGRVERAQKSDEREARDRS